jgi:hypothetical protein
MAVHGPELRPLGGPLDRVVDPLRRDQVAVRAVDDSAVGGQRVFDEERFDLVGQLARDRDVPLRGLRLQRRDPLLAADADDLLLEPQFAVSGPPDEVALPEPADLASTKPPPSP